MGWVEVGSIRGPAGPSYDDTEVRQLIEDVGDAVTAHVAAAEPHPAYDVDMQDLTVLFENGLV